jgi:uncharacterized membrane protein
MSYFVGTTFFLLFILFPVCLVVLNNGFSRKAKLVGVLLSIVFSWVGFIGFYLIMLVQKSAQANGK